MSGHRKTFVLPLAALIVLSLGCGSGSSGPGDSSPQGGGSESMILFQNPLLYAGHQREHAEVSFPQGDFTRVKLFYYLTNFCGSGTEPECDPWDRLSNITFFDGKGYRYEIMRVITPFGGNMNYVDDVSEYLPLFQGTGEFEVYVSAWVGQWSVHIVLVFDSYGPGEGVDEVVPIYYNENYNSLTFMTPQRFQVPEDTSAVTVTCRLTGHNNAGTNCDEFCRKNVRVYLDGEELSTFVPWRDDCADFLGVNPFGLPASVRLSRAGWCPGDFVYPYDFEILDPGPGEHTTYLAIEDVEPDGGYWAVSMDVKIHGNGR